MSRLQGTPTPKASQPRAGLAPATLGPTAAPLTAKGGVPPLQAQAGIAARLCVRLQPVAEGRLLPVREAGVENAVLKERGGLHRRVAATEDPWAKGERDDGSLTGSPRKEAPHLRLQRWPKGAKAEPKGRAFPGRLLGKGLGWGFSGSA